MSSADNQPAPAGRPQAPTSGGRRADDDLGTGSGSHLGSIPRPADREVTYTLDDRSDISGASKPHLDVAATVAGALAALGALLILASIVGAAVGTIGYQRGAENQDVSWAGLVGGLIVLFVACLVGGWVAARVARHRGALHGLLAPLWLVLLAAVLAGLAAVFGDDLDVTDKVGLPGWFSGDALTLTAVLTGIVALALMLLGGWLGGLLTQRHRRRETGISVVETHRAVRTRPGGISSSADRSGR
jgi:hypothetical protein